MIARLFAFKKLPIQQLSSHVDLTLDYEYPPTSWSYLSLLARKLKSNKYLKLLSPTLEYFLTGF